MAAHLFGQRVVALGPDPVAAVPADPAIAGTALRTIPPREIGGNREHR